MKRISIVKNTVITNQVELPTAEADAWLQKHIEMGTFGKAAYSYEQEVSPAVYETQSVLVTPAVTEERELFDGEGNPYDPAQYETIEISPAIYEDQQVEVTPAVTETINVPAEYEVVETDITVEVEKKALIEQKATKGKDARETCEKVLNLIAGFNMDRELTIEQITEMQTIFSNAEKALRAGRPTHAKSFIQAITPDEILVTAEMKELCIELLSNY